MQQRVRQRVSEIVQKSCKSIRVSSAYFIWFVWFIRPSSIFSRRGPSIGSGSTGDGTEKLHHWEWHWSCKSRLWSRSQYCWTGNYRCDYFRVIERAMVYAEILILQIETSKWVESLVKQWVSLQWKSYEIVRSLAHLQSRLTWLQTQVIPIHLNESSSIKMIVKLSGDCCFKKKQIISYPIRGSSIWVCLKKISSLISFL